MQTDRQTFTIQFTVLTQPVFWRDLTLGQKFALNQYAFSQERDRFEVYCKRTWVKAFLETHPEKLDYPIYKLINPLKTPLYRVIEVYSFTK